MRERIFRKLFVPAASNSDYIEEERKESTAWPVSSPSSFDAGSRVFVAVFYSSSYIKDSSSTDDEPGLCMYILCVYREGVYRRYMKDNGNKAKSTYSLSSEARSWKEPFSTVWISLSDNCLQVNSIKTFSSSLAFHEWSPVTHHVGQVAYVQTHSHTHTLQYPSLRHLLTLL